MVNRDCEYLTFHLTCVIVMHESYAHEQADLNAHRDLNT